MINSYIIKGAKKMLIFTFVYEEDSGNSRNNKIEIDENLFKRIARDER